MAVGQCGQDSLRNRDALRSGRDDHASPSQAVPPLGETITLPPAEPKKKDASGSDGNKTEAEVKGALRKIVQEAPTACRGLLGRLCLKVKEAE